MRTSGFTLIEVVVAFALLALVFSVAFEIFSGGLARAGALDERSSALEVARSHQAVAGMEEALKEGQAQGDSADPRFHWTTPVTPYEVTHDASLPPVAAAFVLFRVETRVDWRGADQKEHSISLATLQLGTKPQ